jgi:integrase
VPRLDKFFSSIAGKELRYTRPDSSGSREQRSPICGAARWFGTNPVREIEPIEGGRRRKVRALTPAERRDWVSKLEADDKAVQKDLPDLTRLMLATGVRIGEALATFWEDVDTDGAVVAIDWKVVRVRGQGLQRVRQVKSEAGHRTLPLPGWAADMLREHQRMAQAEGRPTTSPVFPASLGGLRDPPNTRRALREARGSEEFAWVRSHGFRKTTATVLDEAELTARQIADQLGHSMHSMTQDVYMGGPWFQ